MASKTPTVPPANAGAPFSLIKYEAEIEISENLEEYAELKRRRKHLPLIVANDVREAVGADDVQLILLDEAGRHVLEIADKRTQARRLVAHIAELYNTHYA